MSRHCDLYYVPQTTSNLGNREDLKRSKLFSPVKVDPRDGMVSRLCMMEREQEALLWKTNSKQ